MCFEFRLTEPSVRNRCTIVGRRPRGFAIVLVGLLAATGVCNAEIHTLPLDRCIEIAFERSPLAPAAAYGVEAAEAQQRQARAGYWPRLDLEAGYHLLDEAPNFIFPSRTFGTSAMDMTIAGGSAAVTIPAGAFGPGFPPTDVQLPVDFPDQSLTVPGMTFEVPAQDVKLMDRDSFTANLQAQWLLMDGGMRRGLREQAGAGLDVAHEGLRRTELEIVYQVTKLYWSAVMTRQLLQVGEDTLARMEATLEITETMYTQGVGRVKKTDYLSNQVMVESIRSVVANLRMNQEVAGAALAYAMGLSFRDTVVPEDETFAPVSRGTDVEELVVQALDASPDWRELQAGIRAASGALREARSGFFPKVAVVGEVHRWWNSYGAGLATDVNQEGWSAGVGVSVPVFDGNLTKNRVTEAKARLNELRERETLLREGIGLQIRQIALGLIAAEQRATATTAAKNAAIENRELNIRAYQNDLVETEDVITAQLTEAMMWAQYYKACFDEVELRSRLELVVGASVGLVSELD